MLAAGACFVPALAVATQFSSQNWEYARYENSLPDGSVLTEYAGNTRAARQTGAIFRVGFIPRFGCAPLISVRSQIRPGSDSHLLGEIYMPEFSIDGTPLRFPSLSELVDNQILLYYNSSLARRVKLRLQVDEGLFSELKLSNGHQHDFSLLGSKAVLEYAENQCRQHVPGL
jgi:hypothetical protein